MEGIVKGVVMVCVFVFVFFFFVFFFFKQKTAYEIVDCDWSSDVCSSDLFFIVDKLIRSQNSRFRHTLVELRNLDLLSILKNFFQIIYRGGKLG